MNQAAELAIRPATCPSCSSTDLRLFTVDQPALLRHGGYGETKRTLISACSTCGHAGIYAVLSVAPAG